jgi:aspartyl-tRNA(Asn)/glutamyl-tRNA(Gln) amidotransferase subunit B
VINELTGRLNKEGKEIADSPVSAAQLGAVLDLIGEGTISGKIAKDLFEIVWSEGGDPRAIVEQEGLGAIGGGETLEPIVQQALDANPAVVEKLREGNMKPIGVIVGFVMRETKGRADGGEVTRIVREKLEL